jgi:hypothetical protein
MSDSDLAESLWRQNSNDIEIWAPIDPKIRVKSDVEIKFKKDELNLRVGEHRFDCVLAHQIVPQVDF